MTLRVGVIGAGNIGQDHMRRLTQKLHGAVVVALADADSARAESVARLLPGTSVCATGEEVVRRDDVDAVVVATSGATHEPFVLAAIEARKPVFCEKPLATTAAACRRIVDAEMSAGRRLVQVGFMRRFDAGYRALKRAVADGQVGRPLMVHCVHRNASAPASFTSEMVINDSAVHEIDAIRWLLDDEIVAAQVKTPGRASHAGSKLQDPQILVLETAAGVVVTDELFLNCVYGYDVRCEIVGDSGAIALADGADVVIYKDGRRANQVPADWRERFGRAYDAELQEWIVAAAAGGATDPTAWDGYVATTVTDACVEALHTGERVTVLLQQRPHFYQNGS